MTIDDIASRAERVLAGTQTGSYTKRQLARDALGLVGLLRAHRVEYVGTAIELAGMSEAEAHRSLREFEMEHAA